jgi:hypothetical protein
MGTNTQLFSSYKFDNILLEILEITTKIQYNLFFFLVNSSIVYSSLFNFRKVQENDGISTIMNVVGLLEIHTILAGYLEVLLVDQLQWLLQDFALLPLVLMGEVLKIHPSLNSNRIVILYVD